MKSGLRTMDRTLRQFQIDAFATRVFKGNPAAVVPLDCWLPDATMQAIAAENNLSETAFFDRPFPTRSTSSIHGLVVPEGEAYRLRWFSPGGEIDLCGHATLASARVLFELLGHSGNNIAFDTRSGRLVVERDGERLAMDFPALPALPCPAPAALLAGLKRSAVEVLAADDYFAVFESEDDIRSLAPDLAELSKLDRRGVCITAPGRSVDFVSRFFGPKWGIPEDPVTGSAHCTLAPYWATRLGKTRFIARQLSRRGGELYCELRGERVTIAGYAVKFLEGEIVVPG
jgi:predicted PhzF superfamily epimerase YddE/YHI9